MKPAAQLAASADDIGRHHVAVAAKGAQALSKTVSRKSLTNQVWTDGTGKPTLAVGTSCAPVAVGVERQEGHQEVTGLKRFGLVCVAIICLILGAITLPLPLPTGLILLAFGFGLLVMSSKRVRRWFHARRRAWPKLDAKLRKVEPHLPEALRRALTPDPADNT